MMELLLYILFVSVSSMSFAGVLLLITWIISKTHDALR